MEPDLAASVGALAADVGKIQVLKVIRERTNWSLAEATRFYDAVVAVTFLRTQVPPAWGGGSLAERVRLPHASAGTEPALRLVRAETGMTTSEAAASLDALAS